MAFPPKKTFPPAKAAGFPPAKSGAPKGAVPGKSLKDGGLKEGSKAEEALDRKQLKMGGGLPAFKNGGKIKR